MIKLSKRLQALADMVNESAVLADIGCDHGYVPVYLVQSGKIKYAFASDINEGPLASCKALVEENALEDKIKCVLSNGLESINLDEVDDVLIAGMGGELIAEILGNVDTEALKNKHLILNPMTHPEIARRFLYENGFEIKKDIIVKDGKHFYSEFDATYSGFKKEYSDCELFLGNIDEFEQSRGYFTHLLNYLEKKQKSGEDYSEVISVIKEKINDNG